MSKLFFLLNAFLFTQFTYGQQLNSYSFTHYTTSSGLLSNQLNAVVQDEDGFIWTGTTDGLQRFDGTRYKTFPHKESNPSSVPASPVWQLLIDKKKNLWLLLSDGTAGIFNTHTFTFREVPAHFKKPVTPNTAVKRLIADEYGHVFYLLGGSEIITLNDKETEFSFTCNFFTQVPGWNINDFVQEPGTKKYWISTTNAGLAMFNASTNQLSYTGNNAEKQALIEYFGATAMYDHLFFDKQHRLWAIT